MYKQELLLLRYNKDVTCIIDKGIPICEATPSRNLNPNLPSHEPLLPNFKEAKFYNCSSTLCEPVKINSITQLTSPYQTLRFCTRRYEQYDCQKLKYHNYKNIDKLLFLSKLLASKEFYLIDCLVYAEGARVCHRKDEPDSHAKLIDTGNIVRPKEANVLSQDEFICQQSEDKMIICDVNQFVPYTDKLKLKDSIKIANQIILKTGTYLVTLQYTCLNSWCGYTGGVSKTRRMEHYEPPGGKVYRCYYAKRQQVCKELYGKMRPVYNERDWLSS